MNDPFPTPSPFSDGLTRSEMYKWLETYDLKWADGHERLRNALDRNTAAMTDGFALLRADLEKHTQDDFQLNLRVHDIEVARAVEAAVITKRALFGGGLVAAIVGPFAAWVYRKLFGG